jgi:hypothetical protein
MLASFERLNTKWEENNTGVTILQSSGTGVTFGGVLDPSKSVLQHFTNWIYPPYKGKEIDKVNYASFNAVFNDELTWVLRHADLEYSLTKESNGSVHGYIIIKDRFNLDTHNDNSEYDKVVKPLDKLYRYLFLGSYYNVRGYISVSSSDGSYGNTRYRLHGDAPRGQMIHPGSKNDGRLFDGSPVFLW